MTHRPRLYVSRDIPLDYLAVLDGAAVGGGCPQTDARAAVLIQVELAERPLLAATAVGEEYVFVTDNRADFRKLYDGWARLSSD